MKNTKHYVLALPTFLTLGHLRASSHAAHLIGMLSIFLLAACSDKEDAPVVDDSPIDIVSLNVDVVLPADITNQWQNAIDLALANIAKEVADAPDNKVNELKSKYYCYRFDILSYFIAKHENNALKRALDGGFDEYMVSVKDAGPYNVLYLLNQAVFAENKEAVNFLSRRIKSLKHLYFVLLNFVARRDNNDADWATEIKKREHRYANLRLCHDDLVRAILHNDQYDVATVNEAMTQEFGPNELRQEYLKTLNSLIDIRLHLK